MVFDLSANTYDDAPAMTRRHIRANRIDELIASDPRRDGFSRQVVFEIELEEGPQSEVEEYEESLTDDDNNGIDLEDDGGIYLHGSTQPHFPVADAGLLVEDDEQSATINDNDGVDLRVPAVLRLPGASSGPRRSARIQQINSGPPPGPRRSTRIKLAASQR